MSRLLEPIKDIKQAMTLNFLLLSFQIRLPPDVCDEVDEDPTGNKALWDRGLLNGASQKVCCINTHFNA